jgi:hypothetical protein
MNANDLILNRFRPNSVSGRIIRFLSSGKPRTVKEVARVAKPKSVENILGPGGWYAKLRAEGKRSKRFDLSKTDDGKLVLKVGRRYAA